MPTLSDTDLLARLVGFDTTSHNSNLPLTDFVADYLDRPGVRIGRNMSEDGNKANLIVEIGRQDDAGRSGLVLSGHMDVVPADEPEWASDPFILTEREGNLHGRGACDMKGFVALAVNAAASIDPATLRHPLVLILTYDEEVGLLGAKRFAETWAGLERLPKSAWIGEPTTLEVVWAHKGFAQLRVGFDGESAHSAYPHLGKSAIEPAGRAIVALAELRRQMETERAPHAEEFGDVPFVSLNVGRVTGGSAVNVVPDRCVVDLSIRPLPEMKLEDLVDRVRAALDRALGDETFSLEVVSSSPPMYVDRNAPLLGVLLEEIGQEGERAVSYATDAGWLQRAGFECVIFGPGDITVAHKPNEFIPIAELAKARDVMERVVSRFCL